MSGGATRQGQVQADGRRPAAALSDAQDCARRASARGARCAEGAREAEEAQAGLGDARDARNPGGERDGDPRGACGARRARGRALGARARGHGAVPRGRGPAVGHWHSHCRRCERGRARVRRRGCGAPRARGGARRARAALLCCGLWRDRGAGRHSGRRLGAPPRSHGDAHGAAPPERGARQARAEHALVGHAGAPLDRGAVRRAAARPHVGRGAGGRGRVQRAHCGGRPRVDRL